MILLFQIGGQSPVSIIAKALVQTEIIVGKKAISINFITYFVKVNLKRPYILKFNLDLATSEKDAFHHTQNKKELGSKHPSLSQRVIIKT